MPAIYALEALFDAVKPVIEESWKGRVRVEWGQTRPKLKFNQGEIGRVVFVPGAPDGDMGEIIGAKQWDTPAKSLQTLVEAFSVYCCGHARGCEKQEDRKHDRVGFQVLHETIRQIWNASHQWPEVTSPVKFGRPRQLKPLSGDTLGREYLLLCTIEQPILDLFDDEFGVTDVAPGVADITDTLGNRSEQSTSETPEDAS